ncbi:MAG: hypothetical protein LBU82_04870 [Treponema sp.]|nr:hypothetical protein [Treponema sp.]
MKIEDVKIEDAADANYVIRKYFNSQYKNIKMERLEQLILTVYNMGKNAAGLGGAAAEETPPPAPESANPFKINDRAKTIEDAEAGHSGVIIPANTEGTVSSVNGDMVAFLCELGEFGEMIEASLPYSKLEQA